MSLTIWNDAKFAMRSMRRHPATTLIVVATIALGVGVNALMFGIVDRLLLRPPPQVRDAGRVAHVSFRQSSDGVGGYKGGMVPYLTFGELQAGVPAFEQLSAYVTTELLVAERAGGEEAHVALVTGNYFALIGAPPALGRLLIPADDSIASGASALVLSYDLWHRRFDGRHDVLGRELRVGADIFVVVGVAEKGFGGVDLQKIDMWIPMGTRPMHATGVARVSGAVGSGVRVIGRFRTGVSSEQVERALTAMYRRVPSDDSTSRESAVAELHSLSPSWGSANPREIKLSTALTALSLLILGIAATNIANLLLARGAERRSEFAVRLAMGMNRAQLLSLVFVETVALSLLGGLAALTLALWTGAILRVFLLPGITWPQSFFSARLVVFTCIAALTIGISIGVLPALQAVRGSITIRERPRLKFGLFGRIGASNVLIALQCTLTIVLLVSAGFFVHSAWNSRPARTGIEISRLLLIEIDGERAGYSPSTLDAVYRDAATRVRALPGVERAAITVGAPLRHSVGTFVTVTGIDSIARLPTGGPYIDAVTPEYFATLGTSVLRGRPFSPHDVKTSPLVAIVSETMARMIWGTKNPLGACLKVGRDSLCREVVGVARDIARESLMESATMQFYVPFDQMPTFLAGMTRRFLFVRTRATQGSMVLVLSTAVRTVTLGSPSVRVQPFQAVLAPELGAWELGATVFTALGLLALTVGALGVYSLVAFQVARRTHEIGVRMALGAGRAEIVRLLTNEGIRDMMAGLAMGVCLIVWISPRFVPAFFSVSARNPLLLGATSLLLVAAAILASFIPARRATSIDPAATLRGN